MNLPRNLFKAALNEGRHQLGIWNGIGGNTVSEALAACGYDWVMIDAEHGAIETGDILPSLQAIAGYADVSAVVRPAQNDAALIKRLLDFGAQTLLIPFVQSGAEAQAAVAAMRYAPRGIRGMAGIQRASRFGFVEDYATRAEEELCLIVQIETALGLDRLEEIAATDGVDGVFIGPADLAASMGYTGNPDHPQVVAACEDAIGRCRAVGVPSGILTLDEGLSRYFTACGTSFNAVGVDLAILISGAKSLKGRFVT